MSYRLNTFMGKLCGDESFNNVEARNACVVRGEFLEHVGIEQSGAVANTDDIPTIGQTGSSTYAITSIPDTAVGAELLLKLRLARWALSGNTTITSALKASTILRAIPNPKKGDMFKLTLINNTASTGTITFSDVSMGYGDVTSLAQTGTGAGGLNIKNTWYFTIVDNSAGAEKIAIF
jgi:hypothetical protein